MQCKGMNLAGLDLENPVGLITVVIPAHYVTSIKPGPTFRIKRSSRKGDTAIFPANQPTPANRLSLPEIEHAIADLMTVERN